MFKETYNQVLEDLKGRVRNPLILSFLLVWFYLHWPLVFRFINLDETWTIGGRIASVRAYIRTYGLCGMVWQPLWKAFVSLAAFYVIAMIAQVVKILLAKRLTAAAIVLFDKGSYESKQVSDKLKKDIKSLKQTEAELNRDIDEINSKLRRKESEFSESEKIYKEGIDKRDAEIGSLTARNNDLKLNVEDAMSQLGTLRGKNEINEAEIQHFKTQIENLERSNESLSDANDELAANLYVNESHNINDIFPLGTTWHFEWMTESGWRMETFVVNDKSGFSVQNKANPNIEISEFKFDKVRKTVSFKKTNRGLNYFDIDTQLIIGASGSLAGFERNKVVVRYQKILLAGLGLKQPGKI